MEDNRIEEAYNDTLSGLTMYYRDCELEEEFISKYSVDQIIMERGFTDVSSFAEGLGKNLRYAIASNKAVEMGQINPDVLKYGFNLISAPSYYKVLDIYKIESQTQILILNFDEKYLNIFKTVKSNIEEKVIGMGRESFDKKTKLNPNEILNDEFWTERTKFPIGMSENGEFFLSNTVQKENQIENNKKKEESNFNNQNQSKSGFWKRLFGK